MKNSDNKNDDIFHNENYIDMIENSVNLNIDVSSIVSHGEELRLKRNLRNSTIKFFIVAIIIGLLIGMLILRCPIVMVVIIQIVFISLLLVVYFVLLNIKSRGKVNE